jgi:hypothetical protein
MKKLQVKNNGKTEDIIQALVHAVPGAITQVKNANLPEIIGLTGGNCTEDAIRTGKWIRQNVKYKADGFPEQNIQFPSSLLRDPFTGDCKSFSLLYLSIMAAAGYDGGLRFASYQPSGQFTHVYNFFLCNGQKKAFDACLKNLKESPRHTNLKDMKINYIAGVPVVIEEADEITRPVRKIEGINGAVMYEYLDTGEQISGADFEAITGLRDRLNKAWKKVKTKVGKDLNKVWKGLKKIGLAIPRSAALGAIELNFRAIASQLFRTQKKGKKAEDKLKEAWNRMGGDYGKLNAAINRGRKRKPLFGGGKAIKGVGAVDPASIAAIAAAATPILVVLFKAIKGSGVKPEAGEVPPAGDRGLIINPNDPVAKAIAAGKFVPSDPDGEDATAYIKSRGTVKVDSEGNVVAQRPSGGGAGNLLNPKNLLIFGGIGVAAFLLLNKKKK